MSKHTPGPWRLGTMTERITRLDTVRGGDGHELIIVVEGDASDKIEANARLIAAASVRVFVFGR